MQLVDQSVNVWGECPTDIQEAKLWIERAGRTCYNSPMPEVVNPDKFLDKVMSHDPPHSSMFEHSNLVLGYIGFMRDYDKCRGELESKWITHFNYAGDKCCHGNFRAFMEATKTKDLDTMQKKIISLGYFPREEYQRSHQRITVELHTDRNVLAEITRHRDDVAFSVQSQRYVDLQDHIQFIKPSWYNQAGFIQQETFHHSCKEAELNYRTLRKAFPPQHARVALTGQVKTVIVMTAYLPEWDWIFKLRRAPGAYPQMIALMNMVYDQFKERGYVD